MFLKSFEKYFLEIYELDPAKSISAPGLAWQAALKKTRLELDLLTDIDLLLMVEKCIRRGVCISVHHYAKANNKHMKDYDKNKESPYVNYWDVNNLYSWEMSQNVPTFNFAWVEDILQFTEVFTKNFDEKKSKSLFLAYGYVLHIRDLKQALKHGLRLKKFHRVISFNQDECLKLYIEMNNKLRTEAKK